MMTKMNPMEAAWIQGEVIGHLKCQRDLLKLSNKWDADMIKLRKLIKGRLKKVI
jgi:hypothetical protein